MISKSPDTIINDVCTALNVEREIVLAYHKEERYCDARYIIAHLLYNNCFNYIEISEFLHKKTPEMALKACRKFDHFIKSSPHFKNKYKIALAYINGETITSEPDIIVDKVCQVLELNVETIKKGKICLRKYCRGKYIIAKILYDKLYRVYDIKEVLKTDAKRLVPRFNTLIKECASFQNDYHKVQQALTAK